MGYDGNLYNLLLLVHIGAVVSAFGPMMIQTRLLKRAETAGKDDAVSNLELGRTILTKIAIPAMVVAVAAGIALVVVSDKVFTFEEAWISAAFVTVIVLLVLAYFLMRPAFVEMIDNVKETGSATSDAAKAVAIRIKATCRMFDVGFLVLLILMIFKPGN